MLSSWRTVSGCCATRPNGIFQHITDQGSRAASMRLSASEGRKLLVCRGPVQSPDIHILSGNSQHLEFVYSRKGQTQDYGPDRRWNNLLYAGDTAFQAGREL